MATDPDVAFRAALESGIALFNDKKYIEAYEVWEEQWSLEISDGADLLQGLLQMAVGCAKLHEGQARGSLKLFDRALDKLHMYAPEAYELDVEALITLVKQWRDAAEKILENTPTA